jgi:hypothetical protein
MRVMGPCKLFRSCSFQLNKYRDYPKNVLRPLGNADIKTMESELNSHFTKNQNNITYKSNLDSYVNCVLKRMKVN